MRLHFILLGLLLSIPVAAQDTNHSPRALPVSPAELSSGASNVPSAQEAVPLVGMPNGVNVHWYGHGFIYITSSVGVRAAIDPFGPHTVNYVFPSHLSADFVLVTNESEDHAEADLLFGNPLIFRSVTAVGLNRANGIPFHGIALQRDPSGHGGANSAFTLSFDGVTMGYLGQINLPLNLQEKEQFGTVDVLFLPVGLTALSVNDLNQIARDVGAKIIIPINYKTDKSGDLELRSLGDYLSGSKFPVRKFDSDEIVVTRDTLPTEPIIYVLKSP